MTQVISISNRTIDDQLGDLVTGVLPSYNPASSWKEGTSCGSACAVHPLRAFEGTWHDSSQFPNEAPVSVSLNFTGTAIWVFCIVPPITPGVITSYNLSYTLDNGAQNGTFLYTPTSTSDFLYNVSAVALPTLANTTHNLVISTDDSVNGSIFLFDYAVYTSEETATTAVAINTQVNNTQVDGGTIAGCIFGGIVLVLSSLAILRCRKQRRRKKKQSPILPLVAELPFSPAAASGSTKVATSGSTTLAAPQSQTTEPQNQIAAPQDQTEDLSRNPSTSSPSTLIHQLRLALDTAVSMRPTAASQRSPQSASSGIRSLAVWTEDHYETPPPVPPAYRETRTPVPPATPATPAPPTTPAPAYQSSRNSTSQT